MSSDLEGHTSNGTVVEEDEHKIIKQNATFSVRGGEDEDEAVDVNVPYAQQSETASLNPKGLPEANADESKRTMTLLPLISLIFFSVAGGGMCCTFDLHD